MFEHFKKFTMMEETNSVATDSTGNNAMVAEVKSGVEESIQCPYCDGQGWTAEHNTHSPEEECNGCPIQLPCGYCYAEGRITTKLMKEHIESSKNVNEDDLPF